MNTIYTVLIHHFGSEAAIARAFGLKRVSHFKQHVPERIALLCHLSPHIPYTYDPTHFSRDAKGLHLVLTKPTTNEVNDHDQTLYSTAA